MKLKLKNEKEIETKSNQLERQITDLPLAPFNLNGLRND
jgi:hypothetical protein